MTDIFSTEKRSSIMARIKGRNTKPELLVRSMLHKMGYRFRLNRRDFPGSPDIVLPRHKKVIFIHGCFWHGHPGCRRAAKPTSNAAFWEKKITANQKRDAAAVARLHVMGWDVLVLWQCELKDKNLLQEQLVGFMQRRDDA